MIDNLIPVAEGFLLVELPPRVEKLKAGMYLPDYKNNSEEYHPKYGTVISIPKSESVLKVGDKLFFHYLVLESAKPCYDEGMLLFEDGRRVVLMRRQDVFFYEREGQWVPMNDFCLVAPVRAVEKKKAYVNREIDIKDFSDCEGIVRLIGDNPAGIKEGDHILFEIDSDVMIEFPLSATIETLYRMPVSEIVAILSKSINEN